MRILFFIDGLAAGGKERRLVELMKGIRKIPGIDFELVVMNSEIHYLQVLDSDIKIHYLIRTIKKDISVFHKFYKICKNYKPDIVHCWDSMTAVFAVPACILLHIKIVNGLVVDTPVKQNILNICWFRARLTFPFSSIVIGNSNAGLRAYKAPVKKSLRIYNGMDLHRFTNLKDTSLVRKEILGDENSSNFIIGMVAAFEERKDHRMFIRAAIKLTTAYPNMKFVLIGDGPIFKIIKSSVPDSLLSRIIFLGNRTDVESIVNIFDIGILLTNTKLHGEGISNSIIEYMALGKPVIATRGGGTNELVTDTENGLLIDAQSDDQLIEKIESLFHKKDLREKMGIKGKQMVHEKFDLRIMTDQYISTYRALLKKNKN
jgi:glycosyltransferase involved in cell wall biosynthesis